MVADSGATLSCGRVNNSFIQKGQPSTKLFHTPSGQMAQASEMAHLQHQGRKPAQTVDIVPGLQHNSLISINIFAEANYLTVFIPDKVNFFDGKKAIIAST